VKFRVFITCLGLIGLAGCGRSEAPPAADVPSPTASAPAEEQQAADINALAEAYFEEQLALNPVAATFLGDERYNDRLAIGISPEHIAKVRESNERYLAAARAIAPDGLDEQDRITWEVLTTGLEQELEGMDFPGELLSMPSIMAMLGSGQSAQPFADEDDYAAFMSRMDDFSAWVDQAIVNMRIGIERGIVQPKVVTEQVIGQLGGIIAERPEESVFWGAIGAMPETTDPDVAARITHDYRARVTDVLMPAYVRLEAFMREEYLPASRETVGWFALPDGEAWYAYSVKTQTTTTIAPEVIHRLGLSEVARIRAEMDGVRQTVGFEGDLAAFFEHLKTAPELQFQSREEILQAYTDLKDRIDSALPTLFSDFPKADYEVRAVEAFREDSDAAGSYQNPPADNSRPGIFYVNTKLAKAQPKWATETLALHEAAPGHHFQVAIAQELTELPRIRRFGGFTAYVEGWALYAESLGPALGMFEDPYQYFGRLNDEQLRAMRLVVDTGLHAMGWSREQAIQYMKDNSALPDGDIVSEVDRYIAWPGQATAYKIGQLTISDLRWQAEQVLGDAFDIKAWHSMILRGGALPMSVLKARNTRWIEAEKAALKTAT